MLNIYSIFSFFKKISVKFPKLYKKYTVSFIVFSKPLPNVQSYKVYGFDIGRKKVADMSALVKNKNL